MWVDEDAGKDDGNGVGWVTAFVQRAAQSGGYSFDEATLTRIADRWRQIADMARDAVFTTEWPLTNVKGPGLEQASAFAAGRANDHGAAYLKMMPMLEAYSTAQDDACRKALGTYQQEDEQNESWLMQLVGRIEGEQQGQGQQQDGGFL